ncbi:MAG: hypothetical protein Q8K32_35760 [Archangium sp.]|nr:hypothetical protein [Archangium sp.]
MNWDRVRAEAQQVKGMIKVKWAKLTDDDLLLLEGEKDVFLRKLQERTGRAREELEKELIALLVAVNLDRQQPGVIHLGAS